MVAKLNRSIIYAVLAAGLFGISAPVAKLFLADVAPVPLAGLVYLGSGVLLLVAKLVLRLASRDDAKEAQITRPDLPWLAGAVLAGGIAAPIVLMFALKATPAATASLLLNFEGVATALIAAVAFKEAIDRRVWFSIGLITLGGIVLSIDTTGGWGVSFGVLGIIAACALWGMDNNFTRCISARDPLVIVVIKGIVAGTVSILLAAAAGSPFPSVRTALLAMVFGSVSYGLSIVLFILALRGLGAARTGAYFGTGPFIGALVSIAVFKEMPDVRFFLSLPLMIAGVFFLLSEKHEHMHEHGFVAHTHSHTHSDDHHSHCHDADVQPSKPHSHHHEHQPMRHKHPHTPDDHHRHEH